MCVHGHGWVYSCMCVSILGLGRWLMTNLYIYVNNDFCCCWFVLFVFKLEYEMYTPTAHLRKGALRPHYYNNY